MSLAVVFFSFEGQRRACAAPRREKGRGRIDLKILTGSDVPIKQEKHTGWEGRPTPLPARACAFDELLKPSKDL